MRLSLLLVLLLPAALAAQSGGPDTRALPLNPDGAVKVHNLMGPVTVHAWGGDSIRVARTGGGGRFYMGGGRKGVKLGLESPASVKPDESGSLEIWLPPRARLWVLTASGAVTVNGLIGSLEVTSTGGDITITGSPREVRAESMDGAVSLDVRSSWIRTRTASGRISLSGTAEDFAAESVSGDIEVHLQAVRRGRLETVSGNVGWLGTLQRDAALELETHSGAVEVRLRPGLPGQVDINSYQGTIRNEFSPDAAVPSLSGSGHELHFDSGESGATVSVRTFKGTVLLAPLARTTP